MQQILSEAVPFGAKSTKFDQICFSGVWNERNAQFEQCFLPVVAFTPAAAAAVILLFLALCPLLPSSLRPFWTQPFVQEQHEELPKGDFPRRLRWPLSARLLALVATVCLVLRFPTAIKDWPAVETLAPVMTWLLVMSILVVYRPRTAPFSVLAILTIQGIADLVLLSARDPSLHDIRENGSSIAVLSLTAIGIGIVMSMPLRDPLLYSEQIGRPTTEPTSALVSPEDDLSLWNFMTVSWMTPLIRTGYKRQLQDEDVWQLPFEFHHRRLHDRFRLLNGTVIRRLVKANVIDLFILSFLGLLELTMQYSTPLLLQQLLSSMEDITAPKSAAITYAALSLAVRLVMAQSSVFSLWYGRRCYERSRGEMITMLYEKTLGRKINFASDHDSQEPKPNGDANGHLANGDLNHKQQTTWWQRLGQKIASVCGKRQSTPTSKEPASMGKILNLMRNDVYEVAQRFWECQALIQKPLSVVFSTTLVVRLLGWPSLIAVFAVLLAQLLNILLARIMVHYEKKRRVATDSKLQVISQFVEALRHLRWYGWQAPWLKRIMNARQKELNLRIVTSLWNLSIALVNTLALDLTPVIAFFAYTVIAGKPLRIDIAFPALQLFQMLTTSLKDLPSLIIVIINAYVAVGRIEDFMAEPDRDKLLTETNCGDPLVLNRASFAWPGLSEPVLRDVHFSFRKGLTLLYGGVGSGKSALLQAILGELDTLKGYVWRRDWRLAYCAQTPWLQSMSIRENILFGSVYEEDRYKRVLHDCALVQDLKEFKAGDLSMIGENGIGLSGGQRARIALARAVYCRAPILLLDDPFSALDQQTAEFIVHNFFFTADPLLEDRVIVLATHRTDLVWNIAYQLIKLEDGTAYSVTRNDAYEDEMILPPPLVKEKPTDEARVDENLANVVPDKFIEDEHRAEGGVKASVYWEYIKAGRLLWWGVLIPVLALYRLITVAETWFLKTWGEAYNEKSAAQILTHTADVISTKSTFLDSLPSPDVNIRPWLVGFFIIAVSESLVYVCSQGIMIVIIYTAGKNMFAAIMKKVAGATFRFYDVTPVGRLMNRMTSDIGVIDGNISQQFQSVAWLSISWISSVVVIASVTPTFLLFTAFLTIAFVTIFLRFIPTSQSLRRLEMVSLTPLMSNFGALLNGLMTVRAFRVETQFQDRVVEVVDTFQKMDHFYWSLQAWLMYRYDVLSAFSTFLLTALALATNVSAGLTAFVLIAANKMVTATHLLCKQYGQLQMEFVSVERVVELLHLGQEPEGDVSPPAWWPNFGSNIIFNNVTLRYAPHLDPALREISFTIKGGSNTAIIGRTGSGKSTLALSLLATILPEVGNIVVDNIDLARVDKQLLRSRITFLAQDPVLFPGTMRMNLDPLNEHSDDECEEVLDQVCSSQGFGLDDNVEAGGSNFSQGQRQLIGLARALLRRSAIVILDEATASIDRRTAVSIQEVIQDKMRDSTVITIAHRLEAVRYADYCIALGDGRVVRQGPARQMLREHGNRIDEADA